MSTEYCKAERDGHLLIVTMNRPERMNALHPPANFELAKIFDEFAADPDLWVAIITGAGDRATWTWESSAGLGVGPGRLGCGD